MMEELVNLINNVGFPIVCCAFMFSQNNKLSNTIGDLNRTLNSIDKKIDLLEKEIKHE